MDEVRMIGHYRLLREIGKGGMGVVFEAWDERLQRRVAMKLLVEGHDDAAQRRMLREAQVAAQVNHSKVCRVLDLLQEDGSFALVMEYIEGESLSARVSRGPVPWEEAEQIFRDVLDALMALHRDDIIHRDLKPANVILTMNGAKILDFGIASIRRQSEDKTQAANMQDLSGTARFIAPELLRGESVTASADLFSAAAMFYEVLAGVPAFYGETIAETMYAVLNRSPRPLRGTPELERAWAWLSRALAKPLEDRYRSAEEMLAAMDGSTAGPIQHQPTRRLVVVPFRIENPVPAMEFLGYSLADGVANALGGLDSLAVRSTLQASRFANEEWLDVSAIARELDVDVVLYGAIQHAGNYIRLKTQLVEVPSGETLLASTTDGKTENLFDVQQRLAQQVLQQLMLPLSAREKVRIAQDRPATPFAYECYLRANAVNTNIASANREAAKDLYQNCLREDPLYAPAWARLGRLLYMEGKFHTLDPAMMAEGAQSLERAFALNADLPLAHQYYTSIEVDTGRAMRALKRLLTRGRSARADAALFAGLGHALRYCGLLPMSWAAYERARRIDRSCAAGAAWTLFSLGRFGEAAEYSTDDWLISWQHWEAGDNATAATVIRKALANESWGRAVEHHLRSQLAFVTGDMLGLRQSLLETELLPLRDPEFWFVGTVLAASSGERDLMFRFLEKSVAGGYWCALQLRNNPVFEPYLEDEKLQRRATQCENRSREAFELFRQLDGAKLLELD